ncbi:hypothetical protein IAT38_003011 [Cryptococcus sp. DSM 104549]
MAGRRPQLDDKVFCIADLMEAAKERLPAQYYEYIGGGAMDLITTNDNVNAYNRFRLLPRVMKDVSVVDTTADCWGAKSSFPLGISPTGFNGVAHPDAEIAVSRAASKNGVQQCLSNWANNTIKDVVDAGAQYPNAYAQQLCVINDQEANLYVIKNAEAAGCKALWVTVDLPVLGRRLNEFRNKFAAPEGLECPVNAPWLDFRGNPDDPRLAYDRSMTWERVKWFKENTTMEVWLKGIMDPEDARLAVEAGADGIVVSNHGGRQLDGISSTLNALPGVVDAVRGRIPVHIDGGIRRGTDIFKALALGANHVFVGRIALWGLGYDGERGVSLALNLLKNEFEDTMILMGCKNVGEIGRHHLATVNADGSLTRMK